MRTENDGLRSISGDISRERRPWWPPCSVETVDNQPAATAPHCVVIAEKGRPNQCILLVEDGSQAGPSDTKYKRHRWSYTEPCP
jgi:hypothetical protein